MLNPNRYTGAAKVLALAIVALQEEVESLKAASLAGINFASDRGAEVAAENHLTAADFVGVEATGETGYTVKDVEAVAATRDAPDSDD